MARINEITISMAKARRDETDTAATTITDLREQLKAAKAEMVDIQEASKKEAFRTQWPN
ncbi:hypothetical protein [Sporomusa termitida]|uniref:hypothetical protein n=1 Tax=Sporomusa termitida TaxID=2377 RepID=UPI0014796293|nr:hypothetical protein [Sporomusa termitida]